MRVRTRVFPSLRGLTVFLALFFSWVGAAGAGGGAGDWGAYGRPAVFGNKRKGRVLGGWLEDSVNDTGMTAIGGSIATPLGPQLRTAGGCFVGLFPWRIRRRPGGPRVLA